MTILDAIRACAGNSEYVANWARLRGVTLPATPMDQLIGDATGYHDDIARLFIADVIDLVVNRVQPPQEAA